MSKRPPLYYGYLADYYYLCDIGVSPIKKLCTAMPRAVKNKRPVVIDIFAGCGGLSLGLYQAGWQGLFAVEKNKNAFETLEYNLIKSRNHFDWPEWLPKSNLDIIEVTNHYEQELLSLRGSVDLVAGGPPCQGFSMAGKREEKDIRNQLVFSYIKFVDLVRPKLLLFENVKGFTYAFNKKENPNAVPFSQIVIDELRSIGYDVAPQVIDFSEFGIPQRRKRFILVGVLNGKEGSATHFLTSLIQQREPFLRRLGLSDSPTVADAISDLLKCNGESPTPDRKGFCSGKYGAATSEYQVYLRQGYETGANDIPNSHSFAHHSNDKVKCFENLLAECSVKGKRLNKAMREKWGIHQRSITVLDAKSVSPTITGLPDDYLHYCEPRIMTVRECARIQSFPDWYEFKSKYTSGGNLRKSEVPRYSQVGNAIPPLFAHQAGEVLKEMLKYAQ